MHWLHLLWWLHHHHHHLLPLPRWPLRFGPGSVCSNGVCTD